MALVDLNADGRLDLVVSDFGADTVSVLLNQGGAVFGGRVAYPVGRGPLGLAVGDVDGDGDPDVAVANQGSNSVTVLCNDGHGGLAPEATSSRVGTVSTSAARPSSYRRASGGAERR